MNYDFRLAMGCGLLIIAITLLIMGAAFWIWYKFQDIFARDAIGNLKNSTQFLIQGIGGIVIALGTLWAIGYVAVNYIILFFQQY